MEARQPDAGDSPFQEALTLASRYLKRRDRTVLELRRHLEQRGCREVEIDGAIELLAEQGYLDDSRYARLFVDDKRTLEQWGSGRIRRTLLERGVDPELVQEALAAEAPALEPGTPDSEIARALAVLRRRFPNLPSEPREHERALGVLLRKGYETDVALEALATHGSAGNRWSIQSA